ncbi:ArnT family glycosyltransferase [Pararobbsia alpina]|uniref:Phosphoglycerol transferase I n=1 Tax=Pararobbsia alpina TaxID=621374 RepID=A0A6S7BKW7_9BURK|nr:glycosyltransferase family 39 protein [Pararobbsia alpina]CAB3804017.1 Phosphoglycerol transferase I [Pararobbsia alpina]
MTKKISPYDLQTGCAVTAIVVLFIVLHFKVAGLHPVVFGDEYIYSTASRLLPFSKSTIPGYLFLAIYRITNTCGNEFLSCARILNIMFFLASAPFIYLVAKRLCGRGLAFYVAAISLLGPINSYTAYFMPESLYFLSFWIVTWFSLRLSGSSGRIIWVEVGVLWGLSSLVKPHALFLLPALILYAFYIQTGPSRIREWALKIFLMVIATFAVKFSIGYYFAGKSGLSIFGTAYTAIASSATSYLSHSISILPLALKSLEGHALALALMYAVPLLVMSGFFSNRARSALERTESAKMMIYSFFVIGSLVCVAAIFTASVAGSTPEETITRLHMRYYNFSFPLFLIVAASQLASDSFTWTTRHRTLLAATVVLVILFIVMSRFEQFTPKLVDSPELRGATSVPFKFYFLNGLALISVLFWAYSPTGGIRIFLFAFMPLMTAWSSANINQELGYHSASDSYDNAGIFAKNYLADADLARLVVVGADSGGVYRSLFYVSNASALPLILPEGRQYDFLRDSPGAKWVLLIGDRKIPDNNFFSINLSGFSLFCVACSNSIDFRENSWPGVIASVTGLSTPEAWGTWSNGPVVKFRFSKPLPESFRLRITAQAFGKNIGSKFAARAGSVEVPFALGPTPEERILFFNQVGSVDSIYVNIPFASSPKDLRLGNDTRKLGIGFIKMEVIQATQDIPKTAAGG